MNEELMERLIQGEGIKVYLNTKENNKEYWLINTLENIARFIASHQFSARNMTFTTMADQFILDTMGGFINQCVDKQLLDQRLPILRQLQTLNCCVGEIQAMDADEIYDYMEAREHEGLSM